jgi:hypothetical protein
MVEPSTATFESLAMALPALALPSECPTAKGMAMAAKPPPTLLQPLALPLHSLPPPIHSSSSPLHPPSMGAPLLAGVLESFGPAQLEGIGRAVLGHRRCRGEQSGSDDGEQRNSADHEILPRLAPLVWTLE